uniref:Thioredoxin domain-containing protein n=1 Tax=Macrostomum lignano TaxID=282301 RepID=A0A1I8IXH0_9PLAT
EAALLESLSRQPRYKKPLGSPPLRQLETGGTSAQIAQSTAESKKAMSASSEPSQEQQVKLLAELRQRVAGEEPLPGEDYFQDEVTLLRFLRAREWNLDAAEKQLRGAIDWRRSYKAADCRVMPLRQVGFDLGRPAGDLLSCFAQADAKSNNTEDSIAHCTFLIENAKAHHEAGVTTWVFVIDCTGGITLPLCNPSLGSGVIGVFSNFYPEHLERIVLFHGVWSAIRVFIDPKTVKKMKFIKGKEKNTAEIRADEPMSEAQEKFWEGPMRPNQHDPRGCPSYVEQFVDPYFLRVKQLELQSGEESTAGGLYRLHPQHRRPAAGPSGALRAAVPAQGGEEKSRRCCRRSRHRAPPLQPLNRWRRQLSRPRPSWRPTGSPRWQPATFLSWLASPQAPMTSSSPAGVGAAAAVAGGKAAPKAPRLSAARPGKPAAKFNMVNFLKTKADFDNLLTGSQGKLVVIDFTASWCGPCRMIAPKFEQLATDTPSVLFAKVDVDENADAACRPPASSACDFYKDGKEVDELKGADYDGIVKRVKQHA